MFLDLSGVHATRWCSAVCPKNVLGPIAASTSVLDALNRPKKCSWTHLAGCSPPSPNCVQPEKCSWTYSGIGPLVGHRRCIPEKCSQTYREFTPSPWLNPVNPKNVLGAIEASTSVLDALNRPKKCSWTYLAVALRPHQTVPNLKNVPGPIRGSLRSLATDDANPNNVRRPIGNSLQVPG